MHSDVALLKKASIWHEASRIIHEEGVRAFWKGNLVTIAHRLPYSSINFYAYEHYKKVGFIFLMSKYHLIVLYIGLIYVRIFSFSCLDLN